MSGTDRRFSAWWKSGVAVLAFGAIAACSPAAQLDDQPERIVEGKEVHTFEDLPTMTATSDLVVKAQVMSVSPGRWIGVPGSDDADQAREITLAVQRTLFSKNATAPTQVILDEWGWDSKGRGFQLAGVTWSKAGDHGYYFLTATEVPGHYVLVSSQGRFTDLDGRLVPTADEADKIHTAGEALGPAGLESAVGRAAKDVAAKKIKAQPKFRES